MKAETRTTLTTLDLCTLIAHEAVSLLITDADALDTAAQLREGLSILAAANGLADDAGDLLAWIDHEMASAQRFNDTGKDTPHLVDPDSLLPVPEAAAQLNAVWTLFQTAVDQPQEQRRILLNTARTVTEMGGLEDMLLTTNIPAVGFLSAEDLRVELEEVRTALQAQNTQNGGQPMQV